VSLDGDRIALAKEALELVARILEIAGIDPTTPRKLSNAEKCRLKRERRKANGATPRDPARPQNDPKTTQNDPAAGVAGSLVLSPFVREEKEQQKEHDTREEKIGDNEIAAAAPTPRDPKTTLLTLLPTPKTTPKEGSRGGRMPEGEAELAEFTRRWNIDTAHSEWPAFRDWAWSATGQVASKKNWSAAWRNWLRRPRQSATRMVAGRPVAPLVLPEDDRANAKGKALADEAFKRRMLEMGKENGHG